MKSSTFELGLTKKQNQGRRFHCSQCFSIKGFTHVASSYANWKKKKTFLRKKKFNSHRKGMAHQHGGRDVM